VRQARLFVRLVGTTEVNIDRAIPPVKKETPEDHPPRQEFTKFGIRVAYARYIPRADPQSASPPARV
jgi:hypothetical protein